MSLVGSILQIYPYDFKPTAPAAGSYIMYMKTDNTIYLQDSSGVEYAFGTTTAISQLVGEATGIGPGAASVTLSNSAVIGKVLTGFTPGPNTTVQPTDTIIAAIQKLQAQATATTGSAVTSLTGDVTGTGPGATATVVALVGGKTAAQVATSVDDTLAATATNTASTIVKRDASGNFSANTITANLAGNATTATTATTATNNVLKAGDTMTGPLNINSAAANALVVDTDVLVVDGANNRVGINKTNPAEALDVLGNVEVSGIVQASNINGSVSGTNTGDVTVTDTSNIDLTLVGQNVSADLTDTTVTPGSYGTATHSSQVTVDQKGRVTSASQVSIQISESQVTGLVSDLASKADKVITISTGTGLSGGGDLSANRTISIANTAVSAGAYGSASSIPAITVNAQGQLTAASSVPVAVSSSAITDFTEAAQDAIGGSLTDTDTVDLTYSDGANTISADVKISDATITSDSNGIKVGTVQNANIGTGIDAIKLADGSVSNTEFQYLNGTTSNIQTQLDSKQKKIQNTIQVQQSPGPGEYSSIAAAVAYAATQSPSSSNRWLINVGPGVYVEPLIDLSSVPYVSICGQAIQMPVIKPAGNHNIFNLGIYNELSFLWLEDAPYTYAAVMVDNIGSYAQLHKVTFNNCDTGVYVKAVTQDTTVYLEYVDMNGNFSHALKVDGQNGFTAYVSVENYYVLPGSVSPVTYGTYLTGTATAHINGGEATGFGVGNAFKLDNGADLELTAFTCENWATAIYNPNTGSACIVKALAVRLRNNTQDIEILHTGTNGSFSGVSSHAKITNNSSAFVWSFLDIDDGEFEIRQKLYLTYNDGTHTDLYTLLYGSSTQGLISGGTLTDGGGLDLDVAAGVGYVDDSGTLKKIEWSSDTITLAADSNLYIYYTDNGTLTANTTIPSLISTVLLGRVVTGAAGIDFIDRTGMDAFHPSNKAATFYRDGIGPIYSSGSAVSENATPFRLDVTSGRFFFSTTEFLPTGGTAITFTQYYHNGSSAWAKTSTNTVNDTHYNNGNTYALLGSNKYAKHALYVSGDGGYEKYFLVIGQEQFNTLLLAEQGNLPVAPDYFDGSVVLIASIIVQEGHGSIVEILDSRPRLGFKASGTTASSDHQSLSNRSDITAHSQYLLKANTDAMGIDLDMGGFDITNVGTVDGVDVSAHASRHLPNGADPLTTAAPAVSLDGNTTNSVGVANTLARSDHSHDILTGVVSTQTPNQANAEGVSASLARADHIHNIPSGSPVQIGTANSAGTAASFALSDHVHAHGSQTDQSLHALASTTAHGFFSSSDKTKLDAATATNTPSTLVIRDSSGNFSAGTITANLTGTASSAVSFTGSLSGDVTGIQTATVVSLVGGKSAAAVSTSVDDTLAATATNIPSTIVKRGASGDIAIRDLSVRNITPTGALYSSVVALTDAATINLDASLGNVFTVTLGGNRTLAAATNPVDGQKITLRVRQDATGGRTLTFNAVYNFGVDLAGLSLSTSPSAFDYIGMQYNGITSKWDVLAISRNY